MSKTMSYVLIATQGQYSDRSEKILGVFLTHWKAQLAQVGLQVVLDDIWKLAASQSYEESFDFIERKLLHTAKEIGLDKVAHFNYYDSKAPTLSIVEAQVY